MPRDTILEPGQVASIAREYLDGSIGGFEAAHRALRLAGSTDRILAGHQTRLVTETYWMLRRLAETDDTRPAPGDLRFLLDCLEGRRRYGSAP